MKIILCLSATTALFCGCVALPTVNSLSPEQISARGVVVRDDFKKNSLLNGMQINLGNFGLDNFALMAFKNDFNTNILYSITFKTIRGYNQGWAFWHAAVDQNAKEFKTTVVYRNVEDGGMTRECVDVSLSRDYLESKRTTGVNIRMEGTSGATKVLNLPSNYIDGFLSGVDSAFVSHAPVAK